MVPFAFSEQQNLQETISTPFSAILSVFKQMKILGQMRYFESRDNFWILDGKFSFSLIDAIFDSACVKIDFKPVSNPLSNIHGGKF